jgi:hypothetical protein
MATEQSSVCGGLTGWRSQHGTGYQVKATLDDVSIWYVGEDIRSVERAFYKACRRTVPRRAFPWLAPPALELKLKRGWKTRQ